MGGYETPSEPGTPEPQDALAVSYWNQEDMQGQMGIEHWDWKTDAPEFVPGGIKGDEVAVFPMPTWTTGTGEVLTNGQDPVRSVQLRSHFEWQMRSKGDELREMQNRLSQLEMETAQVRASWEAERRTLVRQIGGYRSVLERYCIPIEEASGASYRTEGVVVEPPTDLNKIHDEFRANNDASVSAPWMNGCSAGPEASPGGFVPGSYANPGFVAGLTALPSPGPLQGGVSDDVEQGFEDNTLDSKMRQLNSLLQESQTTRSKRQAQASTPEPEEVKMNGRDGDGHEAMVSTLRAMFPHATIRTGRAEAGGEEETMEPVVQEGLAPAVQSLLFQRDLDTPIAELEALSVEQHTRRLERLTNSTVDERAMRSLLSLGQRDAKQALCTVDELVQSQGGHCRNLSSILQSVCRKIEKRGKTPKGEDKQFGIESGIESMRLWNLHNGATHGSRARKSEEESDAFEAEVNDVKQLEASSWPALGGKSRPEVAALSRANSGATQQSPTAAALDTPAGKRSWADIRDGSDHEADEEEGNDTAIAPAIEDGWTPRQVEQMARQGFELKRKGDRWELKISMSQLDPAPTDAGMEKYCQWLRVRLKAFREEHGVEPLRRCRGEIDFSNNRLTNEMVWALLETLAQHQVHAAALKLQGNEISQVGVLAICEFIRTNDQAEAVHELNLSNNEIDDEAAMELLRTFADERSRYPPKRLVEGSSEPVKVPVWLRLNHNRITDPDGLKRMAEVEAISICDASDRNACGIHKCYRRDCPQLHLYAFSSQESPKAPEGSKLLSGWSH